MRRRTSVEIPGTESNRFELSTHPASGSVQPAHHCPDRNAKLVGGFLVAQPCEIYKRDRESKPIWQVLEGGGYLAVKHRIDNNRLRVKVATDGSSGQPLQFGIGIVQ